MIRNLPFHTLILDGVFTERTAGRLQFDAATPPSDDDVGQVLATIRHLVRRRRARRGSESGAAEPDPPGELVEVSPILAQIMSTSVQGRVAFGRHAGTRVGRRGGELPELNGRARGPRQVHLDGFDLHGNVGAPHDRASSALPGLRRLCNFPKKAS